MDVLKNEVLNMLNKPYRLFCIVALLLCVCTDVPEHCGDRYPALNPSTEVCGEDGRPQPKGGTAPTTYSVTVSGGTGGGSYAAGATVSITAGAAPAGQVFKNWTTASSGVVFANANNATTTFTMPANSVTVTANFETLVAELKQYTLTTTASPSNGGDVSRSPNKDTYQDGESVTVTATAATGYTFDGYTGAVTATSPVVMLTMNSNKTLTATFKQQTTTTYTLSTVADENLGTVTRNPDKTSYTKGETVTVTATSASGCTFTGWSGDVSGTTNPVTIVMDGDKALTATFQQVTYTVKWEADGGTPTPSQTLVNHGDSINQPATITKAGYTFDGWYTNSGLTMPATFPITNVTGAKTLYAKWTLNSYSVTWNAEGGTPAPTQTTVNHGNSITAPATMNKTGYTFDGWYRDEAKTTRATFPISNVTGNVILYAKWTAVYAVTVTSAGTAGVTGSGSYAAGATVSIKAGTAPSGQQFYNWTTASAGVTFADANNASTSFTMPANDVTVTAVFGAIRYAVTVNGGTGAMGTGSYAAGVTVTISAGTASAGQVFKNWTTTSAGVTFTNANNASTSFTMPSNAVTVTAVFGLNYALSCGDRACGTVEIGGKTWMAENLNIVTANSWCYRNSPDSCAKYGRLYTWDAAKSACPSGWHLPSSQEWDALVTAAGGYSVAGKALKSTTGWYNNGNGTDTYGFSALPGGDRLPDGTFGNVGYGSWWTATENSSGNAYYRLMCYYNDSVSEYGSVKSIGFSVRCVKD